MTDDRPTSRSADCGCGALRAIATGAPAVVDACACVDCQCRSGSAFCPSCGVAVGCFGDPAFVRPGGFYWSSRRHAWLPDPAGVPVFDTP